MYTTHEAEGQRLRNPIDTITEGVGINRWTANMGAAVKHIDAAIKCSDAEAVEMASYIHKKEGLFIGSSSAINIVGAVRVAEYLASKKSTSCDSDQSTRNRETTIVTIICDSGERHMSKFPNASYLKLHNMTPTAEGLEFLHWSNAGSVLTLSRSKRRRNSTRQHLTESTPWHYHDNINILIHIYSLYLSLWLAELLFTSWQLCITTFFVLASTLWLPFLSHCLLSKMYLFIHSVIATPLSSWHVKHCKALLSSW